jgi:hypothetical protein
VPFNFEDDSLGQLIHLIVVVACILSSATVTGRGTRPTDSDTLPRNTAAGPARPSGPAPGPGSATVPPDRGRWPVPRPAGQPGPEPPRRARPHDSFNRVRLNHGLKLTRTGNIKNLKDQALSLACRKIRTQLSLAAGIMPV